MVKRCVRVYIEGGSTGQAEDNDFRRAWKYFLVELHTLARKHQFVKLEVVRCKSRSNAYDRFSKYEKEHPGDLPILLVDSEGSVAPDLTVWDWVAQREGDNWVRPSWAMEDQLYLMVPMVEAWLLTDHAALERYFRGRIELRELPSTNLEGRSKSEIDATLKKATGGIACRTYQHRMANEIIEYVRPGNVKTLRHGSRLFTKMAEFIKDHR